jgi:hypothetical protein
VEARPRQRLGRNRLDAGNAAGGTHAAHGEHHIGRDRQRRQARFRVEIVQHRQLETGKPGSAAAGAVLHMGEGQPQLDLRAREQADRQFRLDPPAIAAGTRPLEAQRRHLQLEGTTLDRVRIFRAHRTTGVGVVVVRLRAGDGGEQRSDTHGDDRSDHPHGYGIVPRASIRRGPRR